MKKYLSLSIIAAATLFTACKNEVISTDEFVQQKNKDCSVIFSFSQSLIGTRSESAESSGVSEVGNKNEWDVTSCVVYLFDASTKQYAETIILDNLKVESGGATIVYTSDSTKVEHGHYDVFAIANFDKVYSPKNESEFLNTVGTASYNSNGTLSAEKFIMTNRANANIGITIEKSKTNIITLVLERNVARYDVAKSQDVYKMLSAENNEYASVELSDYYMVNLPTQYYLFRHTASVTSMTEPEWDINTHFGEIPSENGYCIDPYFFKKNADKAEEFTNADGFFANAYVSAQGNYSSLNWQKLNSVSSSYNTSYSLENGLMQDAQKYAYSTGYLFRGNLTPADGYVFAVKDGSLQPVGNTEYANTLYYFNYKFYNSIEALKKDGGPEGVNESMTDGDLNKYSVKKFTADNGKFYTYYYYWVKHVDNNDPSNMGIMEFSVVRNNLYRMLITKIKNLGPGSPYIPGETDDEYYTNLSCDVSIMPWVVRDQTNITL